MFSEMWGLINTKSSLCHVAEIMQDHFKQLQNTVDNTLSTQISKLNLILILFFVLASVHVIPKLINYLMTSTILTIFVNIGEYIPFVNKFIKNYLRGQHLMICDKIGSMLYEHGTEIHEVVPKEAIDLKIVKAQIDESFQSQYNVYASGMHSGTIYHKEEKELNECIEYAMREFLDSNPFNVDTFLSTAQLNVDICSLVIKLFNGDKDTYAMTTCGGTESIASAIAAYKFWAKAEKGITKPNLIFFKTAHAAFRKACHYLDIEVREIPITNNGEAIPERIHEFVDSNTIAIVASNCGYAHGTIENIEAIAEIAYSYNVGCHVDSCLGGFVNCFVEYIQKEPLLVDFRCKGVTSISADTHKYGYGPKGLSVVMFRPKRLFEYLIFTSVDHSGAPVSINNYGTTRSGAVVAGTWAAIMKNGLRGYVSKVKKIYETTVVIREGIKKIPDLVLYAPNNSYNMICFDAVHLNTVSVSLKMGEKSKWKLSECNTPQVCHLLISDSNYDKAEKFLVDIVDAIKDVKQKEKIKKSSYQTLYGACCIVSDQSLLDDIFNTVIDCTYEVSLKRAKFGI